MLRQALLALAILAVAGCSQKPEAETPPPPAASTPDNPSALLNGTVTYLPRIALPPEAEVTVTLADVSRADAPSTPMGQTTFKTEGKQVPLAWTLAYDKAKIDETMSYAVSARIDVDGKLAWISDTNIPALTRGAPMDSIEVRVRPAGN